MMRVCVEGGKLDLLLLLLYLLRIDFYIEMVARGCCVLLLMLLVLRARVNENVRERGREDERGF